MANQLADETSPYLLQHAGNPVDWHPWGPAALALAKTQDKPIFLSIGYSACHWCHVMEHESFENPAIAKLMNEHFVCIKVDREERPDLDQIYMNAVQIMTGRGGWPMSVFLTPDRQPFYGGTYWPPTERMGMAGFDQVLLAVADAWKTRRQQAIAQASDLTDHLRTAASPAPSTGELQAPLLDRAAAALLRSFDHRYGGFGQAPKFPHPLDLRLLLRLWRRNADQRLLDVVTHTLEKMAAGGIYDQLGGGFHRYSVDERWLVPHFEKMLYDNALLVSCYVEALLATGKPDYERIARETCDYVLHEMTDPAGGFYSTQDADSEGEEGKFFLWTPAELETLLGAEPARTFGYVYDVTAEGNFEERNILNRPKTLEQCAKIFNRPIDELEHELAESRVRLLEARSKRVAPARDDKVLVAWNGLMIDALAGAAIALAEPRYLAAAQNAAHFLLDKLRAADGRLKHTWRGGEARIDAYLDDYAALANGLLSLYEADFDERWLDAAAGLVEQMLARFADPADGGFFYTATDQEQLITRPKDLYDSAVPSGNALAATVLVRLGKLTGQKDLLTTAEKTMHAARAVMQQASQAAGQMLLALDLFLGPTPEIVIVGDPGKPETAALLADLRHRYLPGKVVALRASAAVGPSPLLAELFAGKQPASDEIAVFICENFACQAPLNDIQSAQKAFAALETTAHRR